MAQIGAREHYAVARSLHREGRLRRLFTDLYVGPSGRLLARGPVRSLAERYHEDLRDASVISLAGAALVSRIERALRTRVGEHQGYLCEGRRFGLSLSRRLAREALDPERDAFFTYSTGALEPLRQLQGRGVPTVLSQIDPGPLEDELVAAERARWPGWEQGSPVPAAYFDRHRAEWEAADRVVVNSEWSRDALLAQGVSPLKLRVIPLAYEPPGSVPPPRIPPTDELRVLFLGLVCLRKGVPYLLEAARQLLGRRVSVSIAGPILVAPHALRDAPRNVRFLGRIRRGEVGELYARADVFVLPTISDGFAITQLEAMAHGLPVITTPRCGRVVTPGRDGLLVPPADAGALARAIAELDDQRPLVAEMSHAARLKAGAFPLAAYARSLELAVSELHPDRVA